MLSVSDFISRYEKYSDEELYEIYKTIDNYSPEAKEALDKVLEKKGGVESLIKKIEEKQTIQAEINRIKNETNVLGHRGVDSSFIKTTMTSEIFSKDEIEKIIDDKYSEVEENLKDQKITDKTIVWVIIGGVIATIVGGALWGASIIFSGRIFYIFIAGLYIVCYGIIRLITKKSYNNKAVLIASVISSAIAFLLGFLLYNIFGFIE